MLDELLTERTGAEADTYGAPGYPDIPKLATRDQLVALHREIAKHGSKGGLESNAATIVSALVEVVTAAERALPGAPQLDTEAVQNAVEHTIEMLRYDQKRSMNGFAKRELESARMWLAQARMTSEG